MLVFVDRIRMSSILYTMKLVSHKKYLLLYTAYLLNLFLSTSNYAQQPFTLMINPFGDAGNAGRIIDGCYERGLTLQCAEELKKNFKKSSPHIRVILTRFPGERLEPLQNANFANRLKTDLYLNVQFYFQEHDLSHVTFYHFIQHPTELWAQRALPGLDFVPFDTIHRSCIKQTQEWVKMLAQELGATAHSHNFVLQGVYPCPCKPLMGIQAPAISIEIGLKNKDDWQRFIAPLITCFEKLIAYIQKEAVTNE